MKEISKPTSTKYWIVYNEDGSVMHEGTTDIDQVTTTGQPNLEGFDSDEERITFVSSMEVGMFPTIPNVGEWCEEGKVYAYGTDKAKCIQGHYRTAYAIEDTPALWLVIPTTSSYPIWVQPTGAQDAYGIGDRVYFPTANDSLYESLIAANVWSPTAYPSGWQLIE